MRCVSATWRCDGILHHWEATIVNAVATVSAVMKPVLTPAAGPCSNQLHTAPPQAVAAMVVDDQRTIRVNMTGIPYGHE